MNEKLIGEIPMTANGLRKLADAMEMIYGVQIIKMPIYKSEKHTYFQLAIGSGPIDLIGDAK